jgi:hypothetical protein
MEFTEMNSVQSEFSVVSFRLLDILSTLVVQFGRLLSFMESERANRITKKTDATAGLPDEIRATIFALRRDFSVATDQIRREFDTFRHSFDKSKLSLKTEIDRLKRTHSPNQPSVDSGLRTFSFKSASPLNGIISYLSHECGGNVVEKGIIRVFGSTQYDSSRNYDERKIVDMNPDTYFHTNSDPNSKDRGQWICYDFRRMRITPTHYSILTRSNYGCNAGQPKSWVIEISADGQRWKMIDERKDNTDLNGRSFCETFNIAHGEETRFIRLRQTGSNHSGNHVLVIAALEFFGTLRLT